MTLATRRAGIRLQSDGLTEEGVFSGYGSVFNIVDSYGTAMLPGCFAASLAAHKAAGTMPKGLWQHDGSCPILTWTSVEEDDVGLPCTGKLILEVEKAKEAYALLRAGAIDGLSIGFEYVDIFDVTPEEAADYGIHVDEGTPVQENGYIGLIRTANLWEISLVTFPANEAATIETVLSKRRQTPDYSALADALSRRQASLKSFRLA